MVHISCSPIVGLSIFHLVHLSCNLVWEGSQGLMVAIFQIYMLCYIFSPIFMILLPSGEEIQAAIQDGNKNKILGEIPLEVTSTMEFPLGHVVTLREKAMVFQYFFSQFFSPNLGHQLPNPCMSSEKCMFGVSSHQLQKPLFPNNTKK